MEEATEKQIAFAKKLGINAPEAFSKGALKELIDVAIKKRDANKPSAVQTVKPEKAFEKIVDDKYKAMYTSYAKDIFVSLSDYGIKNEKPLDEIMNVCIKLVKQARDAFE